jgi:Mn2+/Fe2+ NRAMP family transporter
MAAAIVCSLAFAWGLGEVAGYRHTLERHPLHARWFSAGYGICVVGCTVAVLLWPDLVSLNIAIQVMNALLLPIVLGMLIALAAKALPSPHRLRGTALWLMLTVCGITAALGVLGGISGIGLLD